MARFSGLRRPDASARAACPGLGWGIFYISRYIYIVYPRRPPGARPKSTAMTNPPIKRHEALQPFSREHLLGLSVARDLRQAPEAGREASHEAVDRLLRLWGDELQGHFHDEERLLTPIIDDPALLKRLTNEHTHIAALTTEAREARARNTAPDDALIRALGDALHDHIRWEERVLFPAIEHALTPEAAASLGRETAQFSQTRVGARTAAERRTLDEPCGTRWDLPASSQDRAEP
ncbi:MAG: hemerythrin domain-containing protein [Phycisphaerales bacterium]|nr:MAG: hemerythrin domain-containing protein [Phycisphaerales bacterium]